MLVLARYVERRYAAELFTEGVGSLLKDRVGVGGAAFDPQAVRLLARSTRTDPLSRRTARQRDVLGLVARGNTSGAVAAQLLASRSAAEKHANAVFDKFDLGDTARHSRRVLAVPRSIGS